MNDPDVKVFYRKIGDGEYCVCLACQKNGSDSKLFRGPRALRRSPFRAGHRALLLLIVLAQPFHLHVPIQFANGHRILAPVLRDLHEQPEINPRA